MVHSGNAVVHSTRKKWSTVGTECVFTPRRAVRIYRYQHGTFTYRFARYLGIPTGFCFSLAISVSARVGAVAISCGGIRNSQRYNDMSYSGTGQLYIAPQIPVVRQSSIFEHQCSAVLYTVLLHYYVTTSYLLDLATRYAGLQHEWAEICEEGGSLWTNQHPLQLQTISLLSAPTWWCRTLRRDRGLGHLGQPRLGYHDTSFIPKILVCLIFLHASTRISIRQENVLSCGIWVPFPPQLWSALNAKNIG